MTRERKVNIIRALKNELNYYKRQLAPVNVIDRTQLKHMKFQTMFSPFEVCSMSKDEISNKLIHRMTNIFADRISSLPIETSYDEEFNVYRANLDLWVKECDDNDNRRRNTGSNKES